jgi:regulator of protease activity HflC (stomatin/prohibitin superfamily)
VPYAKEETQMLEILIAAAILFIILFVVQIRKITIYEYEKGLKYTNGRYKRILDAGMHWYAGFITSIRKVDIRPKFVSIPGQEVLSSDGITLKISMVAQYEVTDADLAVNKLGNPYEQACYLILQLALRELVTAVKVEEILEKRNSLGMQVVERASKEIEAIGLKLISAGIKDIMFPGELKKIFSQVAKARQEGLAMLERARGETAALRNLANSANMLKNNPFLMQLRLLHSTGNTFVIGTPPTGQIVPVTPKDEADQAENPS